METIFDGVDNTVINQMAWDLAKVLFIPFVVVLIIGHVLIFLKLPRSVIKPAMCLLYLFLVYRSFLYFVG
ncbi:hypothetical protein SAMN04488134_102132 [Amphibacillus marinus]|uniref:Uncharacterized protein n=1 Tax=Amphibacillus marinus TaxID=872970 RepID=A0A1H8K1Q1_9BACI|nr:hypothetical protein [Amphibacillus marinus]SEN86597.1 hypothetical protein SAMN04488134_102132 [Amphibacillus marinus]